MYAELNTGCYRDAVTCSLTDADVALREPAALTSAGAAVWLRCSESELSEPDAQQKQAQQAEMHNTHLSMNGASKFT